LSKIVFEAHPRSLQRFLSLIGVLLAGLIVAIPKDAARTTSGKKGGG
jgi:hypothetical protein